ncbi:signal transduction histidine kinase [Spinactinospora alkalitolerans]|uniref:histidine kinase n=1 Tax=Spinactinospora alkalitolerans TaxID=687207 RepID=A0A852TXZ5_9ACTN|nr:histidine kinase [Spinactinospora alkalitolerans]NYE47683.1 signal transduction histidine kinase [Spinactinospora alkalitolerans]
MTWWRDRSARLGIRTATGRDTAAAAVLAAVGLSRLPLVTVLAPAPPFALWALFAGHLLATLDFGTIAVRRSHPRAALVIATVIPLVSAVLPTRPPLIGVGLAVCSYTVAALLPRREAAPLIAACLAAHVLGGVAVASAGGDLGGLLTFWGAAHGDLLDRVVAPAAPYLVAALIGSYARTRRAYAAEHTARLEREREERARAAVTEERTRIARELHDIAAHDLSAIVVQAGAADRLLDQDPDAARAVLRGIREQGRETLTALRGLVGIMRGDPRADGPGDDPGHDDRAPQPTLARLDELVRRARDSGMRVEVEARGAPRPLPPAVDLAASRIVQEGLANARRHAPGATVTLSTVFDEEELRVAVRNTPAREPAWNDSSPGGHGLLGMRERVLHAGGSLIAGPLAAGGWRVEARFTVPAPERP